MLLKQETALVHAGAVSLSFLLSLKEDLDSLREAVASLSVSTRQCHPEDRQAERIQ